MLSDREKSAHQHPHKNAARYDTEATGITYIRFFESAHRLHVVTQHFRPYKTRVDFLTGTAVSALQHRCPYRQCPVRSASVGSYHQCPVDCASVAFLSSCAGLLPRSTRFTTWHYTKFFGLEVSIMPSTNGGMVAKRIATTKLGYRLQGYVICVFFLATRVFNCPRTTRAWKTHGI